MNALKIFLIFGLLLGFHAHAARSDDEIKQQMIDLSRASYTGSCPCPYDLDRRGHKCGRRSAYSRPGGAQPLCYKEDISDEQLKKFKRKNDF